MKERGIDVEANALDVGAAGEIGRRLAGGDPRFDPFGEKLALGQGQAGIEKGVERVDRQIQRVEHQKGRIVGGGRRAVAIGQLGRIETADRVAPVVPDGDEFI
jgi:hypothetical protein